MKRLVPLLILLSLVPHAEAHVENYADTKSVEVGTAYLATLEPQPQPMFANASLTFFLLLSNRSSWETVTVESASLTLQLGDVVKTVGLEALPNRTRAASLVLSVPGNYTATLVLNDSAGSHEATTYFEVFPDLPFRFQPIEEYIDPQVNRTTRFRLQTLDPATGQPVPALDDLRMRLEWWNDPHTVLLGTDEVQLVAEDEATWRFEYVFPVTGMYHMRLASQSGALEYGEAPMLHAYALPPSPEEPNETPLPLLLVLVAVVAAARLSRRP